MLQVSHKADQTVSVVYLSWLPYGIGHLEKFIRSYKLYAAGYPHKLVIVFNGKSVGHPDPVDSFIAFLDDNNVSPDAILHIENAQDIAAYRFAAAKVETDLVLFLNTYAEIKSSDWLMKYVRAFSGDVGIVGSSGSYQSYYSSVFQKHSFLWESKKGFAYNYKKYKLFIKTFLYWRFLFRPFPNPHIRTSAFMVRPMEFLCMNAGSLHSKFKAYLFENGRRSLTNHYLEKGLKPLVIGKNGNIYGVAEWKQSHTFWIADQENLLIEDNQTKLFDEQDKAEKNNMTQLAWGKHA